MKIPKRSTLLLVISIALGSFMTAGCDATTVNEIKADPGRYADREVTVVGTVTRSYSILGRGAYEIDDGTGKLWVVSDRGVPREGARIGAKGTIRDGYNLNSIAGIPESVGSGLVMIESGHKAR